MKKLTQEEVKNKIKSIFPQYSFNEKEYENSTTKMKLICPIHGEFEQLPKNLFKGIECTKCSGKVFLN